MQCLTVVSQCQKFNNSILTQVNKVESKCVDASLKLVNCNCIDRESGKVTGKVTVYDLRKPLVDLLPNR
jgi:hypothetical protein